MILVALIFWRWEPPAFTHATHAMDWAPFFIYIRKKADKWQLEKVRYDNFHYYADTLTYSQLKQKKAINNDQKPRFEIPNFWHSFKPKGGINDWLAVLFGFLIAVISLLLAVVSFTSRPDMVLLSHEYKFFLLFQYQIQYLIFCLILLFFRYNVF